MQWKLLIAVPALVAGLLVAGNWTVDQANAKVSFSIHGPFGTVHGDFTGLKADIQFDEKNPGAGAISASIDANTVSTGIGLRNHHLKSEEQFFNTDKYPTIAFHSKKIEKTGDGYKAMGDLVMKGVTKPIEIPFTFTSNGASGAFKGKFAIKRGDFNIGKPGGSIGDEVTVELDIPVKK